MKLWSGSLCAQGRRATCVPEHMLGVKRSSLNPTLDSLVNAYSVIAVGAFC
jgi:hypothetical protein